jgi:DNA ligase-1
MARAERLSSGKEIVDKIGPAGIEPKFDGFRLQAHKKGEKVVLYTRNLEDATFMYPDVVEGIQKQIKAKEAIFEGEAIAYSPETGEYLPFQLTTQRKRKYGIEEIAKTIPLKLICFDLLSKNGKNMINEGYTTRRKELGSMIEKGDTILLSEEQTLSDPKEIENFFDDAVSRGLEGILAKKLDGTYQAGARGWNWIKFKRSYSASLDDTIDALVMGYYYGRGKRTAFGIGGFLIGIYDKKSDHYVTIARIGTGLTDEEWRTLATRGNKLKAHEKPPLYLVDKGVSPDVWMEPDIVVEIRADEITRSPIHTAGRVLKPSKSGSAFDVDVPGYALRFPRLEKFRDDRKPEDVTDLSEIENMFKAQRKKK